MTEEVNINELVYLTRLMDEEAFELLFKELSGPTHYIYFQYCTKMMTYQEFECEAYSCLQQTLTYYREGMEACFKTHYQTILRRKVIDIYRRQTNQRKVPRELRVPYDKLLIRSYKGYRMQEDAIEEHHLEETLLMKMTCQQVLKQVEPHLLPYENDVLHLCLEGYTYREIASHLEIPLTRVAKTFDKAAKVWGNVERNRRQRQNPPQPYLAVDTGYPKGLSKLSAV